MNAVYRGRFLHEGEIIDHIDHPHIVKVFERGEYNNNLFIAMELVEGPTLEELIKKKGPLPIDEGLDIMLQLNDYFSQGTINRLIVKRPEQEKIKPRVKYQR